MNLVAIALLCQITSGQTHYGIVKSDQEDCQKYYVSCWNKIRKKQLEEGSLYDGEAFLSQCVLEKPQKYAF
jgi:hypothetical protein